MAKVGSISMARLKKGTASAEPFSRPVRIPMLKALSASSEWSVGFNRNVEFLH